MQREESKNGCAAPVPRATRIKAERCTRNFQSFSDDDDDEESNVADV